MRDRELARAELIVWSDRTLRALGSDPQPEQLAEMVEAVIFASTRSLVLKVNELNTELLQRVELEVEKRISEIPASIPEQMARATENVHAYLRAGAEDLVAGTMLGVKSLLKKRDEEASAACLHELIGLVAGFREIGLIQEERFNAIQSWVDERRSEIKAL